MKIGDKVYLKAVGNNARYDNEIRIEEYEIKKVGRKYLEVWKENRDRSTVKFNLEDFREASSFAANWALYFSEQEILDEEEASKLSSEIRRVFDRYGKVDLTLEQLRKIKEIIVIK